MSVCGAPGLSLVSERKRSFRGSAQVLYHSDGTFHHPPLRSSARFSCLNIFSGRANPIREFFHLRFARSTGRRIGLIPLNTTTRPITAVFLFQVSPISIFFFNFM